MTTFNTDSLDFVSDESVQFGSQPNFEMQYNSTSAQLEIKDKVNAAVASIPTGRGGDLVNGRFAETVADGKALADSGEVFDSIQDAVDAASSYVRVGPGTFRESVTIDTPGLSLVGSGERTIIESDAGSIAVDIRSAKVMISNLLLSQLRNTVGVEINESRITIRNCSFISRKGNSSRHILNLDFNESRIINNNFLNSGELVLRGNQGGAIFSNNLIKNCDSSAIETGNPGNIIISNNIIVGAGNVGIDVRAQSHDSVVTSNIVSNPGGSGIKVSSNDCIIAKNRITDPSGQAIDDQGGGTVLDGNLTSSGTVDNTGSLSPPEDNT